MRFSFLNKITAIVLLLTFSFTQLGFSAESIQMIGGQYQPVADPFSESSPELINEEPADFFEEENPLSSVLEEESFVPEVSALDPARMTLPPHANLKASHVTTLSGAPRVYAADGSAANTSIRAVSSAQLVMDYEVSGVSEKAGIEISYDNASTAAVEMRNLSKLSNLTFGLKGDAAVVRFQIEDIYGNQDNIDLTDVSAVSEKYYRITLNSVQGVDKTKIKAIRFLVSPETQGAAPGSLWVRLKGLNVNPPIAPVVVSPPVYSNQNTVLLSGTKEAHAAVMINGVEVTTRDENTTWAAEVSLAALGSNVFKIVAQNSIGKISSARIVTIKKDVAPPAGSFSINANQAVAKSNKVTLRFSAKDNLSGVVSMSISEDGVNWSVPEAYRTSKAFMLSNGDGVKTVFVKFFDRAGNESEVYARSIVLDTLPPSGTIQIGTGSGFTDSRNVVLSLSADDAASQVLKMQFSHDGKKWLAAQNYSETKDWVFPAGDGVKKVYVRFQDSAGRWSSTISVRAVLDTSAPLGGVTVNSGAELTNSNSVSLSLSASDVGGEVNGMSFSEDGIQWTQTENFSAEKQFDFSGSDGPKTVYVKYFDRAGNASAVYSGSIMLDATAPQASAVVNYGNAYTRNSEVRVSLNAEDAVSGADAFRFSVNQGVSWSPWQDMTAEFHADFLSEGTHAVLVEVRDRAGNVALVSDSIVVDATPPLLALLTTVPVIRTALYVFEYGVDGIVKQQVRNLKAGENLISVTETDEAGNSSTLEWNVFYEDSWEETLEDGTFRRFEHGSLKYEVRLESSIIEEVGESESNSEEEYLPLSAEEGQPPAAPAPAQPQVGFNIDVYEGDDLQAAIDSASPGQTIYLHAGVYQGHFILKEGVNLRGEDRSTVFLNGNFESKKDVLTAIGNNRIENLTITGGGPYNWGPASAVNIKGDHVVVAGNRFIDNKDYGVYVSANVPDVVIENNFFDKTYVPVQLPKSGNLIRLNTIVNAGIAINILNGTAPVVEENIIAHSLHQSIYEFGWGLEPSNGRAIVRNNTLFNNPEKGGATSRNLPPAIESLDGNGWMEGNRLEDPQFKNPAAGDYSIQPGSPAFQRGAFVPDAHQRAVQRAAQFDLESVIEEIQENGVAVGYRIVYPAGSVEIFMNDGTEVLDTAGSVIEISDLNPVLVTSAEYHLTFSVDGEQKTKTFNLSEGENLFTVEAFDELGNRSFAEFRVTLDTVAPVIVITSQIPELTNNPLLVIDYTVDGVAKQKTLTLVEGLNSLSITEIDSAGNSSTRYLPLVSLDTTGPVIYVSLSLSPQLVNKTEYDLFVFVDGVIQSQRYILQEGQNVLNFEAADALGNISSLTHSVNLDSIPPTAPTIVSYDGYPIQPGERVFPHLGYEDFQFTGLLDSGSGLDNKFRYSIGGLVWSEWTGFYGSEPGTALVNLGYPSEGLTDLHFQFRDKAGNLATSILPVGFDYTPPTGSISVQGGVTHTNTRDIVLNLTAEAGLAGISHVAVAESVGELWSQSNQYDFSPNLPFTLSAGDGIKTIYYRVYKNGSHFTESQIYQVTITLDSAWEPNPPIVQVLSSATAGDFLYELVYTSDGVEYRESWQLHQGENQLVFQAIKNGKPFYFKHEVVLNQPYPSTPLFPSKTNLASDGMSVQSADGHAYFYEAGVLRAIQKSGQYDLRDIALDAAGNLQAGTLYFNDGRVALYQNSKVAFEKNQNGEIFFYSLEGRLQMIQSGQDKTYLSYQLNTEGQVTKVLVSNQNGSGLYGADSKPYWLSQNETIEFGFDAGKLFAVKVDDGAEFQYEIRGQIDGSGGQSSLRQVRSTAGALMKRDALLSDSIQKQVWASQYPDIPLDVFYASDLSVESAFNLKGDQFQFNAGLPVSISLAGGQTLNFFSSSNQGFKLGIQSQASASVIEQVYDEEGRLTAIRLADGSVLNVQNGELEKIILSDASFIDEIERSNGQLYKYRYTYPDGSVDWIENYNQIVMRREKDGSERTYYYDSELYSTVNNQYTSPDGRVYRVSLVQNSAGQFDEVYELQRINFEDDSYLEMENGTPKRYVRQVEEALEESEYPVLPAHEAYIPYVEINGHQFRSLRIDSLGNILAGEIFFNDGTQYLLENGKLKTQVTPNGQVIHFDAPVQPVSPQVVEPVADLTASEVAYRHELIEAQLDYFVSGVGLDPDTGLPLDNYRANPTPDKPNRPYSQATLIGFWAEILTAIATGDYVTSRMTSVEALNRLNQLFVTYQQVQQQIGWNGFVSFFDIVKEQKPILDSFGQPTGQTELVISYKNSFDHYGFGDALNLALSLATVVGAFKNREMGVLNVLRDQIVAGGESILAAQEPGYAAFYHAGEKRFQHTYKKNASGQWMMEGLMDRMMNEFRPGMMWLLATHPQYRETLLKLDLSIKSYVTQNGEVIENAAPWDGGAFQMFWPLIHIDETQYGEFAVVHRNFLKSQQDYVLTNGIAGLLSAGARPGAEYEGKMGLKDTAETDDPLIQDTGSLYGLAGAYAIAPHYTLQFFKNIENYLGSGLRTSAGLVDAVRIDEREVTDPVTGEKTTVKSPVFSDIFYGVDQSSLILSMLGTSQNYFSNYLEIVQAQDDLDLLYESVQFNLKPAENNLIAPPDFGVPSPLLYNGTVIFPDGTSPVLIRKSALISTVFDPEWGQGEVYEHLTPSGNFHHLEIEFQEGSKKFNLREYADMPGRRGTAQAFLEKEVYSLFDSAWQWGAFYSGAGSTICPQGDCGFASGAFSYDPAVGETMRFTFDFKRVDRPIGLWAKFLIPLDMSEYDMVTVPVKVRDPALANKTRLKFELKGVGEIYVSPLLTDEWQYLQIPVRKTNPILGNLQMKELAIVLLSESGAPIQGQIELGAISAMKIRRDTNINLHQITGFHDAQLRSFLINKGKEHIGLPGKVTREEVLEDFEIDSTGKLIRGVLKKANGEVQFYDRGLLRKWTFLNGRTVTFAENGLAEFIIDLSKGQLDISRFYFDQSFAGKIYSFIIQENDRKRIFNQQGQLTEMIEGGRRILFRDGVISEIQSDIGTLTDLEFADDGTLLAATAATLDGGAVHRIVRGAENTIDFSNGVKVTYRNDLAVRAERADGAVTTFEYIQNPDGVIVSAKAFWQENGSEKEMILGEFLDQPSRALEKAVLTDATRDILTAKPGTFTLGNFLQGEFMRTYAQGESMENGQTCSAKYCWVYKYNSINGPIMGIAISTYPSVMNLNDYDFMYARLRHSAQTPDQDHQIRIQTFNYATQGLFVIDGVESDFQSYSFGISNNAQSSTQVTIEMTGRLPEALGVYNELDLAALQYVDLKKSDEAFTQLISWLPQELRRVWNESSALKKVGGHIANKQSLIFSQLASTFDAPARLVYQPQNDSERIVSEIRRVDGTELTLTNGQVSAVRLLDGTVHEYDAPTENAAAIQVRGVDDDAAAMEYQYGALRKIRQTDGYVYSLSYEFDAQGKETVIVKDEALGEVRRFQDGKLVEAQSDDEVKTNYTYQDGALKGADVFYQNRVLRSTEYQYVNDETLIKDDEGTTWYYDKDGKLRKYLTKEGFLYSHVDYTFDNPASVFPEGDYKHATETALGLKAVVLDGYETDKYQILYDKGPEAEIHFRNGDQAVRLQFDEEYSIKSGYAQLQLGEVFQITDYIPVSGRYADGTEFTVSLPAGAQDYSLLQNSDGSLEGFEFSIGTFRYTYNLDGQLTKVVDGSGSHHVFSYAQNPVTGVVTFTDQYSKQLDFKGVPFPAELELVKENNQLLMKEKGAPLTAEGEATLEKGFIAAVFDESLNEWKKMQGVFHSDGDRIRLRQMLEGMKAGQFFTMMVHGDEEFYRADETLLALLEGVGAGQVRQAAAQNKNWFFFGNESLSAGQGREKVDGDSLNTLVKTQITGTLGATQIQTSIAPIASPVRMFISRDARYLQLLDRYSEFLKNYSPHRPRADTQTATVYDSQGEIVFTERIDGLRSYYQEGQVKESFTASGELLYSYDYGCPAEGCEGDKKYLIRVNLVKARAEFEAESIRMREQIEQIKFDSLYELALQEEVADAEIKQQISEAYEQYSSQISELQRNQFQEVKVCSRKWWGGKSCKRYTVEVPGVREAISRLSSERAQLYQVQAEQIATIPGVIRSKQNEIEESIASRLVDLSAQEREVLLDILEKEMAPVVADIHRRLLGRDPSEQEVRAYAVEFEADKKVNYNLVYSRILSGTERQTKAEEKTYIISQAESFLEQFLSAKEAGDTVLQGQLLASLSLQASDVVDLKRADTQVVIDWLKSRDLHFGQSAFLSLKKMLASRGVQAEMKVIGWQSVVIDILAGALTKFEEGDLLLSMFALSKVAQIHGADVKAVRYTQADLIELYQTQCPQGAAGCTVQAIIHIGGDHFAVVTYADANEVRYFETNKGVNGEEQKISMAQFMEVWDTGNGTGHMLVYGDQAKTEKVISRESALRVRGAFLPLLFAIFAWVSVALTAASFVVSFFSPKWGRILGFAAMVAGIAAIVTAVANFVVNAAQTALGSLSNGIFNAVKQGFQSIGTTVWESVKAVRRYVLDGFKFIKNALTGNLGSLGGFKIANVGGYIKDGIQLVYAPATGEFAAVGKLTLGQKVARMTISAALEYGVSKGLKGMGIDTRIAGLAGAFIGGGVMGLGAKGSSFYKSGLQRFMLQQVSEIGLHLGLAPPLIQGISLATQGSLNQMFGTAGLNIADFTQSGITAEFKNLITTGTIETLARSFGLDPRFASLISAPLGDLVSGVTTGLFGSGSGNIFNILKTSLLNNDTLVQSISLGAEALGLGNGFTAGAITGAVSQLLGSPDLLKNAANLVGNLLLHPVNTISAVGGVIQNSFISMNQKIQEKGLLGALTEMATQVFNRQTQEEINQAGGLDDFLSGSGLDTTFNNQAAKEYKVGSSTSVFTDLFGNLIGKSENGVTQSGTFGLNTAGKFGLITGQIFSNLIGGGYSFAAEVQGGGMKSFEVVENATANVWVSGTAGEGANFINIDFSDAVVESPTQTSFNWTNLVLNLAQLGMSFKFGNDGELSEVGQEVGATTDTSQSNKLLYLLVNGVNNEDNILGSGTNTSPQYYEALRDDLVQVDQNIDPNKDVSIASIYPNINLQGDWISGVAVDDNVRANLRKAFNRFKDVVALRLEADIRALPGLEVLRILAQAGAMGAATRPVQGIGYSGGFAPMLEAMNMMNMDTQMIMGVGAATMDLTRFRDVLGMTVKTLSALLDERVLTQNFDFLAKAKTACQEFYDFAKSIPFFGPIVNVFGSLISTIFNIGKSAVDIVLDLTDKVFDVFSDLVEKIKLQAAIDLNPFVGLTNLAGKAEGVINIYGDRDLLNDLGIGGYRPSVSGFSGNNLINIEIKSQRGAVADHYIYMREIRSVQDYTGLAADGNTWQEEFDRRTAAFVAQLLVEGKTPDDAKNFFLQLPNQVIQRADGVYEFWPFGVE